jgi:hypothetical protein
MNKKCVLLILVLLAIITGGLVKFLVLGKVERGQDGRGQILLEAAERDLVLTEMRAFLEAVQQVTEGLIAKDMQKVVDNARKVGAAAQAGVPASLVGKLPLTFKTLGFDTHGQFDQMALDAEQLGDAGQTLEQLGKVLGNCTACHAAYRIKTSGE